MPRNALTALIEQRRREADRASDRFVDLRLDFLLEDELGCATDEVLLSVGGRWDRRRRCTLDEPSRSRVVGVHRGQEAPVRWFDEWLAQHLAGDDRPASERTYSMLLAGGQRSGKTHIGCHLGVAYALACPESIVWIVCPSDKDFEEVLDLLASLTPRSWIAKQLGAPWWRIELANGSKIVLRSGFVPDKLKKGRADLIVMNEAQQIRERAFVICRGRIATSSGLVIVCANPPDDPIGQWVGTFAVEAQQGLRQAVYFHLDPLDNPHIDVGPLLALAKEIDQRTFDIEIRGMFLGAKDAVLYNWSRVENERAPPATGEITRDFLKWAEHREYDRIVGVDVQRHPHIASVEFRFWENEFALDGDARFRWCHMYATAEITLDAADEEDLAQAWLELGWDPERTLIVCDASGEWQFAERDPKKLKELRDRVKGRGSFDVFRRAGFRHVVKPDRAMEKNPDVIERCRSATARISTKAPGPFGQRFLFSDPRNRELNNALRSWPTKNGAPMRVSKYAHRGDAFTYPVHRLFPRRESRDKVEVKIVQRREGGKRFKGW